MIKTIVATGIDLKNCVMMIENSRLSYDDMMEISSICPNISHDLDIIKSWFNNVVETPTVETDSNTTDDPIVVDVPLTEGTKTQAPYSRMTYEDVESISRYIVRTFSNKSTETVINGLVRKYKRFSRQAILRLVRKRTFVELTDKHFVVKDNKITAVSNEVRSSSDTKNKNTLNEEADVKRPEVILNPGKFEELIVKIKNKTKISDSSINAIAVIWNKIIENKGVCNELYDNGDPEELIRYLTVKSMMFELRVEGLERTFSDIDTTIGVSDGVRKYGKKKTSRIYNYVKKHYHIEFTTGQMFSILNKQVCPEISDKFFK